MARSWTLPALVVSSVVALAVRSDALPAQLTLAWQDAARIQERTRVEAEREVARIFRRAGVDLAWQPSPAAESAVAITVLAQPQSRALPLAAMGAVNRGSTHVWVFLSGVMRVLPVRSGWPVDQHALGLLIGRVIAHEVVHAVAPSVRHSARGLMQAQWNRSWALRPEIDLDVETGHRVADVLAGGGWPPSSGETMATLENAGEIYSDDPSSS
jgi:hypothetical protein